MLLVGRTNVGKSAIFNRMSDNAKSIVFSREGVTRDYIEAPVIWDKKTFTLVDTGGICSDAIADTLDKKVKETALNRLESADLALFVCDITTGISTEDLEVAQLLRKANRPTFLLLNKADIPEKEIEAGEFYRLGFKNVFCVSALHGRGIGELLDAVIENIPDVVEDDGISEGVAYKTVIVGKPNVGKSSLLNLLLQEDRAIVSEIAGTTREPVSQSILLHSNTVHLVDTAGVRRGRSISDPLETLMVKTSMHSVREADIVILVVDVSQGDLCSQELKILSYAQEQQKGVIVVFNKIDLLDSEQIEMFKGNVKHYDFLFKHLVTVWISCISEKNLSKLKERIHLLQQRCCQEIDTMEVTEVVHEALTHRPLYRQKQLLKIFKVRSMRADIPTFHLYVNNPILFGNSDVRCIENIIRSNFDLRGCPVRFALRQV